MAFSLKAIAVAAFSVRLITIAPIGYRIQVIKEAVSSETSIYASGSVGLITLIALHVSVMSATCPCMRQFLGVFDSGLIGELGEEATRPRRPSGIFDGSRGAAGSQRMVPRAETARLTQSFTQITRHDRSDDPFYQGNLRPDFADHEEGIRTQQSWEVRYDLADEMQEEPEC